MISFLVLVYLVFFMTNYERISRHEPWMVSNFITQKIKILEQAWKNYIECLKTHFPKNIAACKIYQIDQLLIAIEKYC